jgi:hypothetical protein
MGSHVGSSLVVAVGSVAMCVRVGAEAPVGELDKILTKFNGKTEAVDGCHQVGGGREDFAVGEDAKVVELGVVLLLEEKPAGSQGQRGDLATIVSAHRAEALKEAGCVTDLD